MCIVQLHFYTFFSKRLHDPNGHLLYYNICIISVMQWERVLRQERGKGSAEEAWKSVACQIEGQSDIWRAGRTWAAGGIHPIEETTKAAGERGLSVLCSLIGWVDEHVRHLPEQSGKQGFLVKNHEKGRSSSLTRVIYGRPIITTSNRACLKPITINGFTL